MKEGGLRCRQRGARRGYIKADGRAPRQHESGEQEGQKASETWKQKRANMRASVCMRVRVRVRGTE